MVERINQVETATSMGYWRGLMLVALVLGTGWINLSRVHPDVVISDQAIQAPMIGFLAPDFRLLTTEGEELQLTALRGQPVVLNFWATWCPPCRAEMPELEQLQRQYAADGLIVLGVDQGETAEAVTGYARGVVQTTFPLVLDIQLEASKAYQVRALPTTFFVDAEGRIRDVKVGGPLDSAALADGVRKILPPQPQGSW
jgi:cytochrome c biogenesis protein CcmG, thiol:disulfide interchange protein DsbE